MIRMRATTPVAERASELYDLLNYHHKTNGSVHMPVGNISKAGGGEGALGCPGTSLQTLLDYTVRPEQQKSCNPLDFVCLDPC